MCGGGWLQRLGGTLSTRTEIAGGSLPSDPVLISPRISPLPLFDMSLVPSSLLPFYPLALIISVSRILALFPSLSSSLSFSLARSPCVSLSRHPSPITFLSRLLRGTYFSLYNFTPRDVPTASGACSRTSLFRVARRENLLREEVRTINSLSFSSQFPLPLPLVRLRASDTPTSFSSPRTRILS